MDFDRSKYIKTRNMTLELNETERDMFSKINIESIVPENTSNIKILLYPEENNENILEFGLQNYNSKSINTYNIGNIIIIPCEDKTYNQYIKIDDIQITEEKNIFFILSYSALKKLKIVINIEFYSA